MKNTWITWVDSTIYLGKNPKDIFKLYKFSLDKEKIRFYHQLQNLVSSSWNINIDIAWKYFGEDFTSIEVSTLELSNHIRTVKSKAIMNINPFTRVVSKQENIEWSQFSNYLKAPLIPLTPSIPFSNDNTSWLTMEFRDIGLLFHSIIEHYREQIKYDSDDLNWMNMMITWVKWKVLRIVVTDIWADIKDLIKKNSQWIFCKFFI